MADPQLLHYLEGYLTERRNELIDKVLDKRTKHFVLVAEDTYQDHNASALIRSCDCFGIQQLYVIEMHNKYHIAKGMAKGSEKWVHTNFYNHGEQSVTNCISDLRNKGYQIVATTPHIMDCELEDFDVSKPSALFFGREKRGLSKEIIEAADVCLRIPMVGFTESFNISVSAAVILNSLTTKLRKMDKVLWQLSKEEQILLKTEWCIKSIPNGKKIVHEYYERLKTRL